MRVAQETAAQVEQAMHIATIPFHLGLLTTWGVGNALGGLYTKLKLDEVRAAERQMLRDAADARTKAERIYKGNVQARQAKYKNEVYDPALRKLEQERDRCLCKKNK